VGPGSRLDGRRLAAWRGCRGRGLERGGEPRLPLQRRRPGPEPGGGIPGSRTALAPDRLRGAHEPGDPGVLGPGRSSRANRAIHRPGGSRGAALLPGGGRGILGRVDSGRVRPRGAGPRPDDLDRGRPHAPKPRAAERRRARVAGVGRLAPRTGGGAGIPGPVGGGWKGCAAPHARDPDGEDRFHHAGPRRVAGTHRSVAPGPRPGSSDLVGTAGLCLGWNRHVDSGGRRARAKTAARRRGEPP
jgi:hypothetical protein